MAPESRMKEITGNLKRDVKDLLGESANLFTGFFKRGVCTVRAVADKWKAFAHDISDAVDTLMKPPFVEDGPEAPVPSLDAEVEPIVTVMESKDENFPVGKQMSLSEADEYVRLMDKAYQKDGQLPQPVKVRIDYLKDGQTNRYWLPLEIGAGGSMLEQMQSRLDSYRTDPAKLSYLFEHVSEQYREEFRSAFTPVIIDGLNELSTGVLHFFLRHKDITALRQQFEAQASVLPEREQQAFQETARKTIRNLRRATNTGALPERAAVQRAQGQPQAEHQPRQAEGEMPRHSVRVKLHKIKEGQSTQAQQPRVRPKPQR